MKFESSDVIILVPLCMLILIFNDGFSNMLILLFAWFVGYKVNNKEEIRYKKSNELKNIKNKEDDKNVPPIKLTPSEEQYYNATRKRYGKEMADRLLERNLNYGKKK